MSETFVGRRLRDAHWPNIRPNEVDDFQDGDYWQVVGKPNRKDEPLWCIYMGNAALIPNHKVIEHEDGTISVPRPGDGEPANSILIKGIREWHGYIENGLWVPV